MKPTPFNFPLCIILLGMILGIVFQDLLHGIGLFISLLLSGLAIVGVYFCHFRIKKFQREIIFLAGISLGILTYNVHYEPNRSSHYLHKLSPNKEYSLLGTIEHIKGRLQRKNCSLLKRYPWREYTRTYYSFSQQTFSYYPSSKYLSV